jgi:NAD(P)-dependent dehydrogenase (short-subunit alcohol dehydrogenase family)
MNTKIFGLEKRVAVITGGAGGIGRAMSLMFAEAGADVVIWDVKIDSKEVAEVADKVKKMGRRYLAMKVNIAKTEEVEQNASRVKQEFGKVDILINNAVTPLIRKTLFDVLDTDWDGEFEVGLKGYHRCCRAFGRMMAEQKSGSIINMASGAGMMAAPMRGIYGITKAAVIMLTKGLAVELKASNVRVNAIAPGLVRTARSQVTWNEPELLKKATETTLSPLAEPEQVSSVAVFLASDASNHMTGQTILVDAGSQIEAHEK